jgi:hypothetical protein
VHGSEPEDHGHTTVVAVTRIYHDDLVKSANEYSNYPLPYSASPLCKLNRDVCVCVCVRAYVQADCRDVWTLSNILLLPGGKRLKQKQKWGS